MQSLEERARRFATEIHAAAGQRRKYTDEPYIVHPAAVVELVRSVTDDENMLAAARLHDTVEDTGATLEDIAQQFGPEVAELVSMLTDKNSRRRKTVPRARWRISVIPPTPRPTRRPLSWRTLLIIPAPLCSTIRTSPASTVEKQVQITLLREGSAELWRRAQATIEQGIAQLQQRPYNVPEARFEKQAAKYAL